MVGIEDDLVAFDVNGYAGAVLKVGGDDFFRQGIANEILDGLADEASALGRVKAAISDEFCHSYFSVKFTQENTDRWFIDGVVYRTSYRG